MLSGDSSKFTSFMRRMVQFSDCRNKTATLSAKKIKEQHTEMLNYKYFLKISSI